MTWTVDSLSLRAFEQDIAAEFNAGRIRAPIHLDGGNEEQLLEIFKDVRSQDWVCGSWRMHYKCLLKGVPPERLKADIMAGRSITLCYKEYNVISSAIVGGILPIALGLAWSLKQRRPDARVYCFMGDMTARGGMYFECSQYASGHNLPITFVIEDNGLSVQTPTAKTWFPDQGSRVPALRYQMYTYKLPWPHAGAGKRVEF